MSQNLQISSHLVLIGNVISGKDSGTSVDDWHLHPVWVDLCSDQEGKRTGCLHSTGKISVKVYLFQVVTVFKTTTMKVARNGQMFRQRAAKSSVLPASDCSPVFSPAPLWQLPTPVGGFVSGVQWLMHGYGSTLIAERLIGKMKGNKRTK